MIRGCQSCLIQDNLLILNLPLNKTYTLLLQTILGTVLNYVPNYSNILKLQIFKTFENSSIYCVLFSLLLAVCVCVCTLSPPMSHPLAYEEILLTCNCRHIVRTTQSPRIPVSGNVCLLYAHRKLLDESRFLKKYFPIDSRGYNNSPNNLRGMVIFPGENVYLVHFH